MKSFVINLIITCCFYPCCSHGSVYLPRSIPKSYNESFCDIKSIEIKPFYKNSTFVILQALVDKGEVVLCQESELKCFRGKSTGLLLYPGYYQPKSSLSAKLGLVKSSGLDHIQLKAHCYKDNAPVPGGFNLTRVTSDNLFLQHSRTPIFSKFAFLPAYFNHESNISDLFYYIHMVQTSSFFQNSTYTENCNHEMSDKAVSNKLDIPCIQYEPLNRKPDLALTYEDNLEFYMLGYKCTSYVVIVEAVDNTLDSLSSYIPFEINSNDKISKVEMAIYVIISVCLLFIGLLLTYSRYRFLSFKIFIHCWFVFTYFLSYFTHLIKQSGNTQLNFQQIMLISSGLGLFFAICVLSFRLKFEMKLFCMIIISLSGGFFISSVLLTTILEKASFTSTPIYVLLSSIIMSLFYFALNWIVGFKQMILLSSILFGSLLIITAISQYWACSIYSYILILIFIRLTNINFYKYFILNGLETKDAILSGVWVILIVVGLIINFSKKCSFKKSNSNDDSISNSSIGTYSYDGDVSDSDEDITDEVFVPFRVVDERTYLLTNVQNK